MTKQEQQQLIEKLKDDIFELRQELLFANKTIDKLIEEMREQEKQSHEQEAKPSKEVEAKLLEGIMIRGADENRIDEAIEIDNLLSDLYDLLFIESNPIPVKWMLYKMNLIKNSIRLPLVNLNAKYQDKILDEMLKLKLI